VRSVRAAVLISLGTAAALVSIAANTITVATNDMTDYNPLLVLSIVLLVVSLALLQGPLRRAALGWRLLAGLVVLMSLVNGINAVTRLLSINPGW
jgi:hypothetical protein